MRRMNAAILSLCTGLLLLGGCTPVGKFVGRQTAATYESFEGRFIEVAERRKLDTPAGRHNAAGLNAPVMPEPHVRLAGAEPIEAYLREIGDRLLAGYPGPKLRYEVYVTSGKGYEAQITSEGAITVPVGLLISAESEDEIAFVLAHEMSHAIMNHTGKEEMTKEADDTAMLLLAGSAMLNDELGGRHGNLNTVSEAIMLTYALNKAIFEPSWSREQEDEADLLAADLMNSTGYNYDAAYTVFERLADDIRRSEKEKQDAEFALHAHVDSLMKQGRFSEGLDIAFDRLAQAPATILGKILSEAMKTHSAPENRREDLASYLGREYGDQPLPPPIRRAEYERRVFTGAGLSVIRKPVLAERARQLFEEDRLDEAATMANGALTGANDPDPELRITLFRVRLAQGDLDRAAENLRIAAKSPSAPAEVFDHMISLEISRRRPDAALSALDARERRFPATKSNNLPLRLQLQLEAGRVTEARQTLETCRKSGSREAVAGCDAMIRRHETATARRN